MTLGPIRLFLSVEPMVQDVGININNHPRIIHALSEMLPLKSCKLYQPIGVHFLSQW